MMAFNPIKHFRNIDASDLDDAFNTLINEINERLIYPTLGPAITPFLAYASQSETRAGANVYKPVKPPEVIDAIEYTLVNLPTSLPAGPGVLWNNGGLISIS